jgi:hypothetical protein
MDLKIFGIKLEDLLDNLQDFQKTSGVVGGNLLREKRGGILEEKRF